MKVGVSENGRRRCECYSGGRVWAAAFLRTGVGGQTSGSKYVGGPGDASTVVKPLEPQSQFFSFPKIERKDSSTMINIANKQTMAVKRKCPLYLNNASLN